MTLPDPQQATALLAQLAETEARVHREASPAHAGFLITLGLASAGYFVAQPIAGTERGVLAATAAFLLAVAGAAAALLVGQRSTRRGFARRFGVVMGTWGAVFGVGLAVGVSRLPYSWEFWVPLAVLVAAPCLVGAWRELPQ